MMKDKKMADSKIDFSFENLHFSCAGDNDWVEKQLNNVLNRIPALLSIHKKGENIVEEVIEVKDEDVNEVGEKAPPAAKFRASKAVRKAIRSAKPKAVKVVEEKVMKENPVEEKIAKAPKIKVAKIPRIAKAPKIKVAKVPRIAKAPKIKVAKIPRPAKVTKLNAVPDPSAANETLTSKRGRKAGNDKKVKQEKKSAIKAKPIGQPVDSPLLQYITDKKVLNNQVRKFLATAVFLARNNNVSRLSTPMITKALKSYGIEKLQNASDCLNKNEKKGYCLKEGKEFIITENGYLSIE
jgi:hypothetical protein